MSEEDLFLFGDYVDDLVEDQKQDVRRKATKQERLDLTNFIGGFEKWSELDEDCKRHVVANLDYWTRCNLSLCSKSDHQVVKNAVLFESKEKGLRIKPTSLSAMCHGSVESIKMKKDFIECKTSSGVCQSWKLIRNEKECKIVSKTYMKNVFAYTNHRILQRDQEDEEFGKLMKKVIEQGREDVVVLNVLVNWNFAIPLPITFPNLKKFTLEYKSPEACQFWLSKIESSLEEFQFYRNYHWFDEGPRDTPFEHIEHPVVYNVKSFCSYNDINISEEKFLKWVRNVNRLEMWATSLGHEVLMEMVEKWRDGELSDDFSYCTIYNSNNNFLSMRETLRERFEATEYNYTDERHPRREFFEHFDRYHRYPGRYYEVRSAHNYFNVLSVFIRQHCFPIMRTGFHRVEYADTEFRFPVLMASVEF